MGTHSYVFMRVRNPDGTYAVWCKVYQQYDGYPQGVGAFLCTFLQSFTLVNGIPYPLPPNTHIANGAGCLFAQLTTAIKINAATPLTFDPILKEMKQSDYRGAGGAYVCDPSSNELEEWNYNVDVDEQAKTVTVQVFEDRDNILFSGSPKDVLDKIINYNDD